MKIATVIILVTLQELFQQQNINDLIAQYQSGGGSAAFDPKSIKLPSIDPSSIQQLRTYAEKKAAEQYDFNTILQKQIESGNQDLQNELQSSPFFQNQAQNFNFQSLDQNNQQQIQNLLLQNQSALNQQFQQQYQQQQFNTLQNQQPQAMSSQGSQIQNNPQLLNQLQSLLAQQNNSQINQQVQQQTQNDQQDQYNNLFNEQKRSQQRQDQINLGSSQQLKQISRDIKGDYSLAGYLDLLSSFEKNKFTTVQGNRVDNCEILQRISPINKSSENLKQCKPIHLHGVGNDEICFIFACLNYSKKVMFYRKCLSAIPLDQNALNLNNEGEDMRSFEKETSPNVFKRDSEFSLQNPINCKEGKSIIADPSLIDIK